MNRNQSLRIGIVGGLGALAGADLLNRIVQRTPVRSEEDHRELIFHQKPLREPASPKEMSYSPTHRKLYVFDTLSRMERDGCDVALLPCFVTHSFLHELEDELELRLISMTEAIAAAVAGLAPKPKKIGVITTPFVRKAGLFENLFGRDIQILHPPEDLERAVMEAVYGSTGFKAGNRNEDVLRPINAALSNLFEQGATVFVPGLSELPLLLNQLDLPDSMTAIDTAAVYADHALQETRPDRHHRFKVGVVGGVGPAATVDFLAKLVKGTEATRDQDHIKVLVEQNPQIPDRTENLVGTGSDPTVALYSTCKKLERGGADMLVIPCNTAHAYVDRIQRHLDIPIISILAATTEHIKETTPETRVVGILGTDGTIQSGLYQKALDEAGLAHITPDDDHQNLVMESIYGPSGVKAGNTDGLCKEQTSQAFAHLVARGAEAIILGCTELPLIVTESADALGALPVDPTDVLARKCVQLAKF
ncbi:amino acid racemase [Aliiroseovarius crassostreae]|uniref:amino acid racemase n=1 Tax=Aliiroseovarius crassostreae TaxID=154981 RepID=UPI003C7C3BE3